MNTCVRNRSFVFHWCAALLLAMPIAAHAKTFTVGLWPGEGRPVIRLFAEKIQLRSAPGLSSRVVAEVSLASGERIAFDQTQVRTIRTGVLRATADTRISGVNYGALSEISEQVYYEGPAKRVDITVASGDVLEFLQYRAEGTCFVRWHGEVIAADDCPDSSETFQREREPKVEHWIHATIKQTSGWLLVDGKQVRVTDREGG